MNGLGERIELLYRQYAEEYPFLALYHGDSQRPPFFGFARLPHREYTERLCLPNTGQTTYKYLSVSSSFLTLQLGSQYIFTG